MAFYANTSKKIPEPAAGLGVLGKTCVPPAMIDEILLEAFDALEQTRRLHETTPNPDTKRQTKRIFATLHASLAQLAPLGVHSVKRLERLFAVP